MRTKVKAIIKLSFILLAVVIMAIACFVPIKVGFQKWKGFAADIKLSTDLKGGVYAVYQVAADESTENLDSRLQATVTRLSTMLEGEGYADATVVREGTNRIRVEVPDVSSPDALFEIMGQPAVLTFKLYEDAEMGTLIETLDMTGKNVKGAEAVMQEGQYGVTVRFDTAGAKEFAEVTSANVGKYLVILDGETVLTNATIQEAITGGSTFISGDFDAERAELLAQKIVAGAFDVRLTLMESDVMSATLGEDALKWALIAGIIAVVGIIAYLVGMYRGMGLVSGIALLIYTVLFIFLLWSFPWIQLSLPGIAGIILSLGMAVDANVIIFERIKEEYALGKSINAAVAAGFKKALWTVLDANITTILAAIVLIILGTGAVRGFGITLLMGILLSLLTALLISRGLFKLLLQINKSNPKFYGLKREEDVVEIPDEVKVEEEDNAIALDVTGLPVMPLDEGGAE